MLFRTLFTIIIVEISSFKSRVQVCHLMYLENFCQKKKILCGQMLKKTEEEGSKRTNLTSRQLERQANLFPASLFCLYKSTHP